MWHVLHVGCRRRGILRHFGLSFTRAGLLCCIAHMYVLVQAMRGLGLYSAPEHELSLAP